MFLFCFLKLILSVTFSLIVILHSLYFTTHVFSSFSTLTWTKKLTAESLKTSAASWVIFAAVSQPFFLIHIVVDQQQILGEIQRSEDLWRLLCSFFETSSQPLCVWPWRGRLHLKRSLSAWFKSGEIRSTDSRKVLQFQQWSLWRLEEKELSLLESTNVQMIGWWRLWRTIVLENHNVLKQKYFRWKWLTRNNYQERLLIVD